ncbi:uncharacterized protein SCHCODRAFT_02567852 [Schizophyllum commune H4-8]|nr:uncharacterized protein SCHCODRAFT_02567852 [Schizophyllum commune H4-8]KAI5898865.1 hypothetical protein SCHCODRAFT_02567852 [Schizophyllum commune H4-8]
MFEAEQFFTFPPGSPSASRAYKDSQSKDLAVFSQWMLYFEPRVKLLNQRITVCDNLQARQALELSQDWARFEDAMKQLKLSRQSEQRLHEGALVLLRTLCQYWSNYHNAFEKRGPDVLLSPILRADMPNMIGWFSNLRIDAIVFEGHLTRGGRYPKYLEVFRHALCHRVRNKEELPSARFREIAAWKNRFSFMARCLLPDINDAGYMRDMRDPVTIGGAVGEHVMKDFFDAYTAQKTEAMVSYLVNSTTMIIDHCARLGMPDASAVQAVWAFIDRLSI